MIPNNEYMLIINTHFMEITQGICQYGGEKFSTSSSNLGYYTPKSLNFEWCQTSWR